MASRGDDVFNRDFRGTARPNRRRPATGDEAAVAADARAATEAATRSGVFGSTRLSGGSFKARFRLGRPTSATD